MTKKQYQAYPVDEVVWMIKEVEENTGISFLKRARFYDSFDAMQQEAKPLEYSLLNYDDINVALYYKSPDNNFFLLCEEVMIES